jgi:hypothetical protein
MLQPVPQNRQGAFAQVRLLSLAMTLLADAEVLMPAAATAVLMAWALMNSRRVADIRSAPSVVYLMKYKAGADDARQVFNGADGLHQPLFVRGFQEHNQLPRWILLRNAGVGERFDGAHGIGDSFGMAQDDEAGDMTAIGRQPS